MAKIIILIVFNSDLSLFNGMEVTVEKCGRGELLALAFIEHEVE